MFEIAAQIIHGGRYEGQTLGWLIANRPAYARRMAASKSFRRRSSACRDLAEDLDFLLRAKGLYWECNLPAPV